MNPCRCWIIALIALVALPVRGSRRRRIRPTSRPRNSRRDGTSSSTGSADHAIAIVAGRGTDDRLPGPAPVERVLSPLRDRDAARLSRFSTAGTGKSLCFCLRATRGWKAPRGKVLSADDAGDVKRLTGVGAVASTRD